MTEEAFFAQFAAALFAAYRTDKNPTEPRRDIVRALEEGRLAAHVAFNVAAIPLDHLSEVLDEWHGALGAKLR